MPRAAAPMPAFRFTVEAWVGQEMQGVLPGVPWGTYIFPYLNPKRNQLRNGSDSARIQARQPAQASAGGRESEVR